MAAHWRTNKQNITIPLSGNNAIKVFFSFALAYFISYSFRSINAVISPELVVDLELNNNQLGLLSAAYLIGFGIAQIPVGLLLDRFGSRFTEIGLMSLAVMGALLFYFANSLMILFIGRMLIGIGVSSCLMSALSGFRNWYDIKMQAQLTSAILIFGTSGALLTSHPARMVLPFIGWRGILLVLAIACIISIIVLYFFLPVTNNKIAQDSPSSLNGARLFSWESYKPILVSPFYWRLFPIGAIALGGFMAIQTLWLGPWLIHVLGKTPDEASQTIFWFNAVLLLAYVANTFLLSKLQRVGIGTFSYLKWMTAASLLMQAAAFFIHGSFSEYWWYLYAATSASFVLAQSLIITNFPKSHSGRVSTTYNITIFIGAFLAQWGIGYGIDRGITFGLSKADAFDLSLGIYLIIQAMGFGWLLLASKFFPNAKISDD